MDIENLPKINEDAYPSKSTATNIIWSDIDLNLDSLITNTPEVEPEVENKEVDNSNSNVVNKLAEFKLPVNLTLDKLPELPMDFAYHWSQKILPGRSVRHLNEFKIYIQILNELGNGTLTLPEADSKSIARDIQFKAIEEMEKQDITVDFENNEVHRAFFAHCVQRILENIEDGIFQGEDGVVGKRPEIAEVIKNRAKEIKLDTIFGTT